MTMAFIRTFVAIPCPDEVRDRLSEFGEEILRLQPKAKLIAPFNYHITLAYIGQTREEDVEFIKSLLPQNIFEDTGPWDIDVLRSFSTHKIIYACGPRNSTIQALGDIVRRKLKQHGFSFDEKPLRPHISLARKAVLSEEIKLSAPIAMKIFKPELFQSGIKIDNRLTYIKL